jgi:uncharacterized protein
MANSHRVSRILCAAGPAGLGSAVERLVAASRDQGCDAVIVVGDLSVADGAVAAYRSLFRALAAAGPPAYWVPGPGDAPLGTYLYETHAVEAVHASVRGVHGTAALTPDGHLVVAGMGGEITDDPEAERDEVTRLRYPRWEAEYRLKILNELGEHRSILLFSTQPAHKGPHTGGSEAVAELISTHRPALAVCDGQRGTEMLGRSVVVAPGSLRDGHFAIADLQQREVNLAELAPA